MPIVFEEVTGEVAAPSGRGEAAAPVPAPDTPTTDMREQLQSELALLCERQARLFTD